MYKYITVVKQYYSVQGVVEKYMDSQIRNVKAFLNYSEDFGWNIESLTKSEAEEYNKYLTTRKSRLGFPLAASTIRQHLTAIDKLYNELIKVNPSQKNPFTRIPKPKISKYNNAYGSMVLTRDEIKQLFDSTHKLVERVMLHLFYSAGLRISEAKKVELLDFNFPLGELVVKKGKGGKSRVVPLPRKVIEEIRDYIAEERELKLKEEEFDSLLISIKGSPMTIYSMYKTLKKLVERAGISNRVTPHILRATIASHMLDDFNGSIDPATLKLILGHSSFDTTNVYTQTV